MSVIRYVSHIINCGYARANIYENSPTQRGCNGRKNIDIEERAQKFRSQFSDCRDYSIPEAYFEPRGKDGTSQFDRDCNKILNGYTTLTGKPTKQNFRQKIGVSYPQPKRACTQ